MVGFGQKLLYWDKVASFRQGGLIWANMVYSAKWLYSGKVVAFGKTLLLSGKVVVVGQSGSIRRRWFYFCKSGCIRTTLLYFGKSVCSWANGCIWANVLVFGISGYI